MKVLRVCLQFSTFRYNPRLLTLLTALVQWQEKNDPTMLTQLEACNSTTIQRLLSLSITHVHSYLEPAKLQRFQRLYGWLGLRCRVLNCKGALKLYKTDKERQSHEETHTRTYSCTDCNSVPRGFKSARALRNHRETYHMKPEDFDVPQSLVYTL